MVRSADISRPSPSRRGIFALAEPAFWFYRSMTRSDKDSRRMIQSDLREKSPVATYQTRVSEYVGIDRAAGDAALSAYGELYGRVERHLFAEVAAGRSATSLKSAYLKRYRIPARMFNAVRASLEGKVASVKEQQKLRVDSLGRRIARAKRQIADAAERDRWDQVHRNDDGSLPGGQSTQRCVLTLRRGGSGCASDPSGSGASGATWRKTATPSMKSGSEIGGTLAATGSSCWVAAMKL